MRETGTSSFFPILTLQHVPLSQGNWLQKSPFIMKRSITERLLHTFERRVVVPHGQGNSLAPRCIKAKKLLLSYFGSFGTISHLNAQATCSVRPSLITMQDTYGSIIQIGTRCIPRALDLIRRMRIRSRLPVRKNS